MEEECELYIDPEEDEIFFYEVTPKEIELRNRLQESLKRHETNASLSKCSEKNYHSSESASKDSGIVKSENSLKTIVNLEQISELNRSVALIGISDDNCDKCPKGKESSPAKTIEDCNVNTEPLERSTAGSIDLKRDIIDTQKGNVQSEKKKKKKKKKKKDDLNLVQNNINIHADHNYSTPFKTVIDRSILKTPKSIVKADIDGGFLKVLSEIALVKAEADENTFNDSEKILISHEEEATDDNKKSEPTDESNIEPEIEKLEISQTKLNHLSPVRIFASESVQKKCFNNSPEQVIGDNYSHLGVSENKNIPEVVVIEEHVENNKLKNPDISEHDIPNCLDALCLEKSPSSKKESFDGIEVIFEKLDEKMTYKKETTQIPDSGSLVDVDNDLIILDSFIGASNDETNKSKESLEEICPSLGTQEDMEIETNPDINKKQEIVNSKVGENDGNSSDYKNVLSPIDEYPKKYLRRQTLLLLEELNEIMSFEQKKGEPNGTGNANQNSRLHKEAAAVIEKLKAASLDDSIHSPDQYLDLDKLNDSFLSMELSDLLNDTLSKPLSHLTSKDVEFLLEKINSTTMEENFELTHQSEILRAEKENICQLNIQETLKCNTQTPKPIPGMSQKLNSRKFPQTPILGRVKTPARTTPVPCNNLTGKIQSLSENKKAISKIVTQSSVNQHMSKGCHGVEKSLKSQVLTRIPKPTSTSVIPIHLREVKQHNGKGTPNTKHLLPKTPKNPKFNKIESPVQAYIHSRTPVLISNVKGKIKPGFDVWKKNISDSNNSEKAEMKNKPQIGNEMKSNLPFVKYRSGIPLKLEKSPESRLPKLTPKMQKLLGSNSPIIEKHEGRIHIPTGQRPQISMTESSIVVNPNEVSVLVRKVAQKGTLRK